VAQFSLSTAMYYNNIKPWPDRVSTGQGSICAWLQVVDSVCSNTSLQYWHRAAYVKMRMPRWGSAACACPPASAFSRLLYLSPTTLMANKRPGLVGRCPTIMVTAPASGKRLQHTRSGHKPTPWRVGALGRLDWRSPRPCPGRYLAGSDNGRRECSDSVRVILDGQ
jgi:hypothetical protein